MMGKFLRKKGGGLQILIKSMEFLALASLFGSCFGSYESDEVNPGQDLGQGQGEGVEIALRAFVPGVKGKRIIKEREEIMNPAEEEPVETFRPGVQNVSLVCDGYGNQSSPDILWTITANIKPRANNSLVDGAGTHNSSIIILPVIKRGVEGLYTCTVKNKDSTGEVSATVRIRIEKGTVIWWTVTSLGSLALIALLIALIIYCIRVRNLKKELRDLSEDEVAQFIFGDTTVDPSNINASIYALPFDRSLEVPPNSITMDEKSALGAGEFGVVRLGELKLTTPVKAAVQPVDSEPEAEPETESELDPITGYSPPLPLPVPLPAPPPSPVTITVAIKVPKYNVSTEYFKSFLREIKIICYAQNHENVVKVLAASIINIKIRRALVVLEYCDLGDLANYLKKETFRALFKNDFVSPSATYPSNVIDGYARIDISQVYLIETLDLLNFSLGVANGMKFLAEKKVVHGDLAGRNVLLTHNKEVKITDFGMSTKLKDYKEYTKANQVVLPWPLCSVEVLLYQTFSEKSDVWSFGILLHEIFSLGMDPYPLFETLTPEFIQSLRRGERPEKPEFANDELYELMKDCWHEHPTDRPTFSEICERIMRIGSKIVLAKLDQSEQKSIQWFH